MQTGPAAHRRVKEKKQHNVTNPNSPNSDEAPSVIISPATSEVEIIDCPQVQTDDATSQDETVVVSSGIDNIIISNSSSADRKAPAKTTSVIRFEELDTEDKLEYRFYPATNGVVNFKVRAANDAHLALTTGPEESDPMLEVFIGGWKNSKSVIRKNRTKPDVAEVDTPDVLNAGEFRGFWVKWFDDNKVITVGMEGAAAAFLSYENPEPFPINFVGVCTGWGACGSWIIEQNESAPSAPAAALVSGGAACWVPAANGEIPPGAVVGGSDGGSDEPIYIGRAQHEGAIIPGKVVASHGVCYVAWGGAENPKAEYEVLCDGTGTFVPVSGGEIPPNALPAGESEDGEPLFIGRVPHEGSVTVGKVQQSHGVCYIPYGGQEMAFAEYEIYVSQ
ncbi:uncharacterized protein LOC129749614 isoform X1 [Uranotaenia lowii]|uniref:uncharacterized protein LOC129749614 isoform X1 n=1 Tax=Uranotaenia lowii TaxID=190385 RepID=UPI00247832CF|nr:uncharacterized protein LOC129749614 isoform X1 [Uranotaenia lowii]